MQAQFSKASFYTITIQNDFQQNAQIEEGVCAEYVKLQLYKHVIKKIIKLLELDRVYLNQLRDLRGQFELLSTAKIEKEAQGIIARLALHNRYKEEYQRITPVPVEQPAGEYSLGFKKTLFHNLQFKSCWDIFSKVVGESL